MCPLIDEPAISLRVREHEEPGIEVRVNFGVFAGRHATPAEIDEPDMLAEEIVLGANGWALDCIASRHGGGDL